MQKKIKKNYLWLQLETAATEKPPAADSLLAALQFNDDGLLPVIVQCADTQKVLMLAWINRPALEQTLACGQMIYYSRSRRQLWRKGESSGHIQHLVSLAIDCDGDTLLATVKQTGAACHTRRRSCFYIQLHPFTAIDNTTI